MELRNSLFVARPVDEVFSALLEVDKIATCLPGSTLLGQPSPDTYEGEVKVKIGPLTVTYVGEFVVIDSDRSQGRMTMHAKGREKRGAGTAEAAIIATLSAVDGGTSVVMDTDLNIRGKVAQFGRGVIGEVTDSIMQTFARNLEDMLSGNDGVGEASAPTGMAARPAGATRAGGTPTGAAPTNGDAGLVGEVSTGASAPAVSPKASVPGDSLDAWALILRPMLQRHGKDLLQVGLVMLASWLGARSGARARAVASRR